MMPEISSVLDVAVKLIQVIGLPLAGFGLWLNTRQAAKAQDLQTVLSLSESFRIRWEGGWHNTIAKCEKLAKKDGLTGMSLDLEDDLRTILNWIDWLGVMMKWRLLNQPQAILQSIGPTIRIAISLGNHLVAKDEEQFGVGHWSGLREVAAYMKNWKFSG